MWQAIVRRQTHNGPMTVVAALAAVTRRWCFRIRENVKGSTETGAHRIYRTTKGRHRIDTG